MKNTFFVIFYNILLLIPKLLEIIIYFIYLIISIIVGLNRNLIKYLNDKVDNLQITNVDFEEK
jgi:hypothetical protein